MDKFRTEVILKEYPIRISHRDASLLMGSCFTDHIGSKMQFSGFKTELNPFGVIYNPSSVRRSLEILIDSRKFMEDDLHFYNERWFSFYHHSVFSNIDKNICLENINSRISSASVFLKGASFLFVTFGTARVYKYIETGEVVSNCHKLPASTFSHELMSVEEIIRDYDELIPRLMEINPNLKIIFTVSPVRHWKDGAVGNQLSKAVLLLAIYRLVEKHKFAFYFPSYEIVMDDLRDYRFYADDMIHISPVAIDYIWDKFKKAFFEKETLKIIPRIEKIKKALSHRPFDINSNAHQDFLRKLLHNIEILEKQYTFLDFEKEKELILKQSD
jgi:hypothetical protein